MSVPASKTLRACRMTFDSICGQQAMPCKLAQFRGLPQPVFFPGGTEVLSEHLKKAITVAIGVFQACWSWADCSPLHLLSLFVGWATGYQQLEPAQRVQATAVNYDQMKYEYEWIWCMMLGCIYSPVWECLASNLVADKGKQDIFSLPPLTLICHLLHLWNWRSLQDCFT